MFSPNAFFPEKTFFFYKTKFHLKKLKLELLQNSKCDTLKTKTVTKLKNSKCYNLRTQSVTKRKNSNCDKTQNSNCNKTPIATKLNKTEIAI